MKILLIEKQFFRGLSSNLKYRNRDYKLINPYKKQEAIGGFGIIYASPYLKKRPERNLSRYWQILVIQMRSFECIPIHGREFD